MAATTQTALPHAGRRSFASVARSRTVALVAAFMAAIALAACDGEPEPIEIPALEGLGLSEAREAVSDARLAIDEVDASGGDRSVLSVSNWSVESQDPAAGTEAERGATVTVTIVNVVDERRAERDQERAEREEEREQAQAERQEEREQEQAAREDDREQERVERAEQQAERESRDWLADFHDSFGCGDIGWFECFEEEVVLAARVMSVTELTSPTSNAFEVRLQSNDPDDGVWACTYVRNLFSADAVNDRAIVHVFGAGGSTIARTYLLSGNECRAT